MAAETEFYTLLIYANERVHFQRTPPSIKEQDRKVCYHRVRATDVNAAMTQALEDHKKPANQGRFDGYQCKKDSLDNKKRYETALVRTREKKKERIAPPASPIKKKKKKKKKKEETTKKQQTKQAEPTGKNLEAMIDRRIAEAMKKAQTKN